MRRSRCWLGCALLALVGCGEPAGVADLRRCAAPGDCYAGEACNAGRCVAADAAAGDDGAIRDRVDGWLSADPEPDPAPAPDADRHGDAAVDLGDAMDAMDAITMDVMDAMDAMPPDATDATAAIDARPPDATPPDRGPDARPPDRDCVPGTERGCGHRRGACLPGRQRCGEDGAWGPCLGEIPPQPERCNARDDDCDDRIDEALAEPCGPGGACRPARRICRDGAWSACDAAQAPSDERCDGFDDDCDGLIDEGLLRACGVERGLCRPGVQACEAGAWGRCVGAVAAAPESCDGRDEDCDGRADEGLVRPCGERCADPVRLCVDGRFGACVGERVPVDEVCDGRDDDCDGLVDERLTRPCGSAVGACRAGVARCVDGAWDDCRGGVGPADEQCNGLDDDCDGHPDEAVAPAPCGRDEGRCVAGIRRCAGGVFGACEGEVRPRPEVCGGEDDDCDGVVDEGCPGFQLP